VSLRHPASWRSEQSQQEGIWYRYFLGPTGPGGKPLASATLLAGALNGSLEAYAQTYLTGNTKGASRGETRGEARGRSYEYASADGATRYLLLLLEDRGRVLGVYSQAPAASFDAQRPLLEEIAASLTLERAEGYPETRDAEYGFSIRTPPSWKLSRRFSGQGSLLVQFTSPSLMIDKGGQTVHASLTLSVEPAAADAGAQGYYDATRLKLGDAFKILSHGPWRTGFVDEMKTETPISASRVKRFYDAAGARGYSLTFEAREDVFGRASAWCDLIASTFSTR
jgi:hypothetical protein